MAPLNDLLSTERVDWQPSDQDHLFFRYSLQREDDVAAEHAGSRHRFCLATSGQRQQHTFVPRQLHARVESARREQFQFQLQHFL